MPKHRDYADEQAFHAGFLDALTEFLSTVRTNFRLTQVNATTLRAAGASGQMGLPIQGAFRWITTNVDVSHPGGAAGTYIVWATTSALDTAQEDLGSFSYGFGLKITATGATPSGTGSEALYTRVGSLTWDGAAITSWTQEVGDVAPGTGVASFTFGDGVAQTFVLTHNLGTRNVAVDVFTNVSPYESVEVDVERTSNDTITLRTPSIVPASNGLAAVVIARGANTVVSGAPSAHASTHIVGGSDPISGFAPFLSGVIGSRPAAAQANRYYFATDTGVLYRDTGSAWVEVAADKPMASLWRNAGLTGVATNAVVPFESSLYAKGITINGGLNRMTFTRAGVYNVGFNARQSGSSTVSTMLARLNGTTTVVADDGPGNSQGWMGNAVDALFAAGDYIELVVQHASTANVWDNIRFFASYQGQAT